MTSHRVARVLLDDTLGRWVIHFHPLGQRDICVTCGVSTQALMTPHTHLVLPEGIETKSTILIRGYPLGLTCGCYAKLHRQIAHIQDNMKRKDKRP